MKRRNFISISAEAEAGTSPFSNPAEAAVAGNTKKKLILLGTGIRDASFWGNDLWTITVIWSSLTGFAILIPEVWI